MRLVLLMFIIIILILSYFKIQEYSFINYQHKIESFYAKPLHLSDGKPGEILRYEPLDLKIDNGIGYRILYRSELTDGTPTISSGMLFIPTSPTPIDGRPIVAWAHGTIGMGKSCAPSRSKNPLSQLTWLSQMLSKNWIVVATDYAGLGTYGTERYLIGEVEARDVLNSARAALNFSNSDANKKLLLWGHSQGGHSIVFSALLQKEYAPEFHLIGSAVAAPALELSSLVEGNYNTVASWLIGPEIIKSYPLYYKYLNSDRILTKSGSEKTDYFADTCISDDYIEALILNLFGKKYFSMNPNDNLEWKDAFIKQTPNSNIQTPIFITYGLKDNLITPQSTEKFIAKACENGSVVSANIMENVGHIDAAKKAGPEVVDWFSNLLIGKRLFGICN